MHVLCLVTEGLSWGATKGIQAVLRPGQMWYLCLLWEGSMCHKLLSINNNITETACLTIVTEIHLVSQKVYMSTLLISCIQ